MNPKQILHSQRISYEMGKLNSIENNPFSVFLSWYKDASKQGVEEPNAFALSTCANNKPSCRIVLLKEWDESGFTFFTNYESRKGKELLLNPNCAMTFYWNQRQIRIEGKAEKSSDDINDQYFSSRPIGSQIGAWVSRQSTVLPDRETLDRKEQEMMAKFDQGPVSRPPYWGGFKIIPETIEFWQGRPSRLHDRFQFTRKDGDGGWDIVRLSP